VFCDGSGEDAGLHQGRVGNPPLQEGVCHGLSEIVRGFKTFSSRGINAIRHNYGCPVWQRNYFDRIICNENELTRARSYIANNPLKWEHDKENPINPT
jgi:putative transposase